MTFADYDNIEFRSPSEMRRVQQNLLLEHLRYCAENSPYYGELFAEKGVDYKRCSLEGLDELPLTGKEELAQRNDAFLAAPPEKIVDIVFSSGTTGLPTRIVYTERDLQRLAYNERRSFGSAGVTASDIVLLTCTMDRCFVAGLAYFLGVRSLGAAAIRNGHGTREGHLEIIQRVRPTVIVGVPSFLAKLGRYLLESGVDARATSVERLICIGEPVRDRNLDDAPLGRVLADLWDAEVHSTYASSETVTTFCECTALQGGHLHPDLGIVEILDDEGHAVEPGEVGEVVVTPLQVEGMPLVRFRTDDLSFLRDEPCSCGRRSPRLGPILARKKQMIKFKGTTLYPQPIAAALEDVPGVLEHYVEVSSRDRLSDEVTVHVAVSDVSWSAERIAERLLSRLRVKPSVVVEPIESIRDQVFSPRYRKPMRFVDRRSS